MAAESGGALIDHGFEFVVVNVGEGEVEDVVGRRGEGREEAMEENCV